MFRLCYEFVRFGRVRDQFSYLIAISGGRTYTSDMDVRKHNVEPRVLSIQSHVVHGYVGNKSATFPLQVLGFDVDAINTVQFSTHTHYKHIRGQVLSNKELTDLMEGLTLNNITEYSHLLTGYSRDPESLKTVASIVKQLKEKNPSLKYVCDPVMGDNGKMYVPDTILPVYKEVIIPLADLLTPNQFEAELLSGIKIKSIDDAWKAVRWFHAKGIKIVVLSSTELGGDDGMIGLASIAGGKGYTIKIPKLSVFFIGTGDLFTSLMLAWTFKTDDDVKLSLEKTIATMQNILHSTYNYAKEKYGDLELTSDKIELRLVQNKKSIEEPNIKITAVETIY